MKVESKKLSSKGIVIALAIILILTLLVAAISIATPKAISLEKFKGDTTLQHIEELTKDKYQGRMVGSEGNILAVKYIEEQFKAMGLQPITNQGYRMEYKTIVPVFEKQPYGRIIINNQEIHLQRDINFKERIDDYSGGGEISGEILYIEKVDNVRNYNREQLENKIVLLDYAKNNEESVDSVLHMRGALGIIYLAENLPQDSVYLGSKLSAMPERKIVKIGITQDIFDAMVDSVKEEKQTRADIGVFVDFKAQISAENVIGIIPGKGVFKEEILVLAANIDGLGKDYQGNMYQGAISNASGLGTLLEIARMISENEEGPRKTIVFAAFNGKELGETGSLSFVKQRLFPAYRMKVINLDSLALQDSHLIVTGLEPSRTKRKDLTLFASKVVSYINEYQDTKSSIQGQMRGDHFSFALSGIPALNVRGISQAPILRSQDTLQALSQDQLVESGKIVLNIVNNEAYSIKTLSYLIPPLVKILPLLLILLLIIAIKYLVVYKGYLKESSLGKYLDKKPIAFIGFCITTVLYIFALQSYFNQQLSTGVYTLSAQQYSYGSIINNMISGILPVIIVIFVKVYLLVVPVIIWFAISFKLEDKIPKKVAVIVSFVILLISEFFLAKGLTDPAAMTVMPELLRINYGNIIFSVSIGLITAIGGLIYYFEKKGKIDNYNIFIAIFVLVNILLFTTFYAPYFADPAANQARQVIIPTNIQ